MHPYDHQHPGERHHSHLEEYHHHRQNYSEEQRHHYPQYPRPQYRDPADYDRGYPPSDYPPMPAPQFGPPGYPPMRPPQPYAGSFYPSAYPPPYQGAYPPVSSAGHFNPPAYPPAYPPKQECDPLSASVYPSASASHPPSYPPIREDTLPSVTERQLSLHDLPYSYSSTQQESLPSAPELPPSLHTTSLFSSPPGDAYTPTVKPQPVSPALAPSTDVELLKGDLVRIFCKANKTLNLSAQGDSVVMATANIQDEAQLWIRDGKCGVRIKDRYGQPAFVLINKGSKKVLKHASDRERPVQLVDYSGDMDDEDVLWTESQDFGEGFKTIRMVNNTLLNMTAHHGSSVVLDTWQKKDHQLWKIFPL